MGRVTYWRIYLILLTIFQVLCGSLPGIGAVIGKVEGSQFEEEIDFLVFIVIWSVNASLVSISHVSLLNYILADLF